MPAESDARFCRQGYQFCSRGEHAWYDGDLQAAALVDSDVVPAGAVVDDDDSQWDAQPGTPLHQLPGLAAFERAASEPVTSLPPPSSPDSACGEEEAGLPPYPASPDYHYQALYFDMGCGGEATGTARLPSHPATPGAGGDDDSEDEVTIIGELPAGGVSVHVGPPECQVGGPPAESGQYVVDMFPRVRRVAKRRLSFTDAAEADARAALTVQLATALSTALPDSGVASWPCWEVAPVCDGLPPKKRRRFLQPLSASEPRVVVEPQPAAPLPPFSSLRHRAAERC